MNERQSRLPLNHFRSVPLCSVAGATAGAKVVVLFTGIKVYHAAGGICRGRRLLK